MPPHSILTAGQQRFFVLVLALSTLILANSVYLYFNNPTAKDAFVQEERYEVSAYGTAGIEDIVAPLTGSASKSLSKYYQFMLLAHIFGGILLFALVLIFVFCF